MQTPSVTVATIVQVVTAIKTLRVMPGKPRATRVTVNLVPWSVAVRVTTRWAKGLGLFRQRFVNSVIVVTSILVKTGSGFVPSITVSLTVSIIIIMFISTVESTWPRGLVNLLVRLGNYR